MDWYRIKSEAELEERGLIENLWDPECVCLLEWGSQFEETRTEISHAFFSIEILITPTEDMSARVYSIRAL